MNRCQLPYIPKHLHQNNKPVIPEFFDSEKLFWRLGRHDYYSPYSSISLYDVSFNRSGTSTKVLSVEEDVLWNLNPQDPTQKYDSRVITLLIRRLFPNLLPSRVIEHPDDTTAVIKRSTTMSLIHDPLPCNYSHTMIVFDVNGVRVSEENYESTLNIKSLKKLRQLCRDELKNAILRGEIRI